MRIRSVAAPPDLRPEQPERPAPPLPGCPLLRHTATAALCSALLLFSPPGAAKKVAPEIAEKKANLGELRQRIQGLRKDLNASEEDKADAGDRLRESERQISRLQRELNELAEQRSGLEKKLEDLEQQSRQLGTTLDQQQSQLEGLLYKQYLRGSPGSLQLLLNGDNPNQMARDLHYLSIIAQARAEMMQQIDATLNRKKALAADTQARARELQEIAGQQESRRLELEKQRAERKRLYAEISDKVTAQRKEIGSLQRNERRLSQLIDQLADKLAKQAAAAARAARAAEAARLAEARQAKSKARPATGATKESPREAPRPRPAETENHYEPVASDGSFARLRGSLRLPVRGAVSGRFGSPREGGGTWRGIFIRAASGSDIKAIANGRIVFADWMRGFGNLLIVDHGDAYLSIYGNNESLLKQVGQTVRGGETIATAGNSGGNPDSGLYFELRHQGQPIDPMKWANLK